MLSRDAIRSRLFAGESVPLEFEGMEFLVVEPEEELLRAAYSLPDAAARAATVTALCLYYQGAPVFNTASEVLRMRGRRAKLKTLVLEAVLEMSKEPVPGKDVAASSPEEVLAASEE